MTQENILARYKILHELGRGATGAVYAARDRETGAVVALKRFDPALLSKSGANSAGRFLQHARSARLLKHRNIVRIHDAGEVGGTVYVAMEMLEGRNLRSILDAGPVPVARAIRIAHDIACGLAHAHLEGVVHGAIKPSNVIVLGSGDVKITDFGIGQAAPLSMSPEQRRGDPVDHRCDLFALGALFYEMLAHRPFQAKPPPPSELNQHVPRALDAIVLSMLAGEPAARMPGIPILLRELQRLEEGLGLGSGASAGTDEPTASVPPAEPEPRTAEPTPSEAFDFHKAMVVMERESRLERSSGSRPGVVAMLALVFTVLGIGVAGFTYYSSDPVERGIVASRVLEKLTRATETFRPAAAPPVAEAEPEPAVVRAAPPASIGAEPKPVSQTERVVARVSEPPAEAAAAPARQQPGGTARLIFTVSPRGEISIDGKPHGATPPITTLDLEPGMHRIEVRGPAGTPYLTYMTVQAGDVRRIRHDFDAKPIRPPGRNRG